MDDNDCRNAALILHKYVVDKDTRLQHGLRLRARLKEALSRGESPRSYRLDWIRETVQGLWVYLATAAETFNEVYADDRISNLDLHDCLTTAITQLVADSEIHDKT